MAQVGLAGIEPRRAAVAGLLTVTAGMALGAAAAPAGSVVMLLLGSALAGAGQGVTFRGTLALVLELAPASARADVTSAYYAAVYAATGCASIGIGLAATGASLARTLPPFALAIAALTAAMAVTTVMRRRPATRPG